MTRAANAFCSFIAYKFGGHIVLALLEPAYLQIQYKRLIIMRKYNDK